MWKSFFIFLFLPIFSSAQKYAGEYNNPENSIGYSINFIIRPDSTISITFLTKNPEIKKSEKNYIPKDDISYYDYHGYIQKVNDTLFFVSSKCVFSFSTRVNPYPGDCDKIHDTILIQFDSVRTWLPQRMKLYYGKKDTIVNQMNLPVYGFPNYENKMQDTFYINRLTLDYIVPIGQYDFKKHDSISLDLGYVNPATGIPMKFTVSQNQNFQFGNDEDNCFLIVIKNNLITFYNSNGRSCGFNWPSRFYDFDSAYPYPVILTEFK
jgi:hypothetical protein